MTTTEHDHDVSPGDEAHAAQGGDAPVPFLDLRGATDAVRDVVSAGFQRILDSGAFVNGPEVRAFEEEFAAFCGVEHCVGLSSGLDALRIGLRALGIGEGDEVIVPAHTFVATFEAVSQAGATPVVVDVSPTDYCVDVSAAEAAVTPRTAAIMPVHLYGQLADPVRLDEASRRTGLAILEDAAQAHGATRSGTSAGRIGSVAGFSFYPGKNLGAFGDAGALTTSDAQVAATARALREHGQTVKYRSEWDGYTARLDTIQALVLSAKLAFLERWNDERRAVAGWYLQELAGVGDLALPPVPADSQPVWHLFVVRTADPDGLAATLQSRRIGTGRHYPEPPHLSGAYASLGHTPGSFPVAEALAREGLSLPIFPGMTEAQVSRVVAAVREHFDG